ADRGRGNGVFRFRFDPRGFLSNLAQNPLETVVDLERDWRTIAGAFFRTSRHLLQGRRSPVEEILCALDLSYFFSLRPYRKTIRLSIDFSRLADSPRRLVVTTTAWPQARLCGFEGRDPVWRREGTRILLAATALPGIFPPVVVEGQTLADASLIDNSPIGVAINEGARFLYAILPFTVGRAPAIRGEPGSLESLYRALTFAWVADLWGDLRGIYFLENLREALGRGSPSSDSPRDVPTTPSLSGEMPPRVRLPKQGEIQFRAFTPRNPLDLGLWSLLDFREHRIADLIDKGFRDAKTQARFDPRAVIPQLRSVSLFEPFGHSISPYEPGHPVYRRPSPEQSHAG
ncbi:MAG: hypothetical protein MI919_24930, partial [Holophagales bacterium]|nr:hypothetical protein [Holophagales bacterium]